MNTIPYGRQNITQKDINEVLKILKSDYLTQGPEINKFEEAFAKYVGSKYSVAVSNGTAALHLCSIALNLKPKDKVITSPITFAASANCIRYCGGEVVFSDIDKNSYLLDINKVKQLLDNNPKNTFKGIVLVNFSGRLCDLESFKKLANKYNLWIIEDACHSPGGSFFDSKNNLQKSGNGHFSDLSIFSFHPVKHITTGEGGMITTNNLDLYKKLLKLRTHGITKETDIFVNSKNFATGKSNNYFPEWYMEMQDLGYNYRLTDLQAALGRSQLKRANIGIIKRRKIAKIYYEAFKSQKFIQGQSGIHDGHAYHLYIIEVKDRLGLYNYLRKNKIYTQIHYIPCHLMPYYRNLGWKEGDLPNAEEYYKKCISLPMYPTLTQLEQQYIIKKIINYYK
jgi:UDP-4-amino-4,6-dideoxy-N-acetyl-beta-L-altrosamine transaminase